MLCILAVLMILLGIVVLSGYIKSVPSSLDVPLGIIMIIVAFVLFLFGWYSYKSGAATRNNEPAQSIKI